MKLVQIYSSLISVISSPITLGLLFAMPCFVSHAQNESAESTKGKAEQKAPAKSQASGTEQAPVEEADDTTEPETPPKPGLIPDNLSWEEQPYTVKVLFSFPRDPRMTNRFRDRIIEQYESFAKTYVGDAWVMRTQDASGSLGASSPDAMNSLKPERVTEFGKEFDKIFVLGLENLGDRYQLSARELDVYFGRWSPLFTRQVRNPTQIARDLLVLSGQMFSPLARFEKGNATTGVQIRIKGGRLPTLDRKAIDPKAKNKPGFQFIDRGMLWRPMRKVVDQDGNTKGLPPIPWTFYELDQIIGPVGRCLVHTALRSPLPRRGDGPNEPQMIAARSAGGPTVIRLVDHETGVPLPAVDIEIKNTEGSTLPLGTTDLGGEIRVPPGTTGRKLLLVTVRHGGSVLARLPVNPGAGEEEDLRLKIDPIRIQIEGMVAAVQAKVINRVAGRKILEAQIKDLIEKKNLEEAEKLIAKLEKSPKEEEMKEVLKRERDFADAMIAEVGREKHTPKVLGIFSQTEQIITTYFNPDDLLDKYEELQDELLSMKEAEMIRKANEANPGGVKIIREE